MKVLISESKGMKNIQVSEELLNKMMEELSKLNLPIVFKGKMIANLALRNNNINTNKIMKRGTKDIDGDYIDIDNITMNILFSYIEKASKSINPNYSVEIFREFKENQSAGFKILENGKPLFSIDISVRKNPYAKIYLSFNNIPIQGQKEIKMVVDKLSIISSRKVYRRSHDLVDLYNLILTVTDITLYEILSIVKDCNKEIEDFYDLINHKDKVEHAYNKLNGILNKKEFEEVYNILLAFFEPFINKKYNSNLKWDVSSYKWVLTE